MSRTMQARMEWDVLAQALCFKSERHMWDVLYVEEKLSIAELAERLKAGTATINRRIQQSGITLRTRGGAHMHGGNKKYLLFHIDQRIVHGINTRDLTYRYDMSYAVVYHYKSWKAGRDLQAYNRANKGHSDRGAIV